MTEIKYRAVKDGKMVPQPDGPFMRVRQGEVLVLTHDQYTRNAELFEKVKEPKDDKATEKAEQADAPKAEKGAHNTKPDEPALDQVRREQAQQSAHKGKPELGEPGNNPLPTVGVQDRPIPGKGKPELGEPGNNPLAATTPPIPATGRGNALGAQAQSDRRFEAAAGKTKTRTAPITGRRK